LGKKSGGSLFRAILIELSRGLISFFY
jgi:hypothetical protein